MVINNTMSTRQVRRGDSISICTRLCATPTRDRPEPAPRRFRSSIASSTALANTPTKEATLANTGSGNPGNFANDRDKASEAGKTGGSSSGGTHGTSHSTGGGSTGGSGSGSGSQGNFANDREKASEAGKKGGEHSHGGR
jgi:general stress protein YciG